jgi:hypothetical protein
MKLSDFKTHLKNLKSNNIKEATFDVDFLIEVFNMDLTKDITDVKKADVQKFNVDGGDFEED